MCGKFLGANVLKRQDTSVFVVIFLHTIISMRETKKGPRFLSDGGGGGGGGGKAGAEVVTFLPSPFYEVRVGVQIFVQLYVSTYGLLNKIVGCSGKKGTPVETYSYCRK